jgi:hypothetical protein
MDTIDLLKLFFPERTLDYFEITHAENQGDDLMVIWLEERNILPEGYNVEEYENKDFMPPKEIADFPIRGRAVKLYVSRRRWRHKKTGEILKRDWKIEIDGGRITKEFAAFLKEIN